VSMRVPKSNSFLGLFSGDLNDKLDFMYLIVQLATLQYIGTDCKLYGGTSRAQHLSNLQVNL
jgi:hypothetical protein